MADDDDAAKLLQRMQGLLEMYNLGDAEGLMKEFYLPDSLFLPPGSPAISGNDAVSKYKTMMAEGPRIEWKREDVRVFGDWASDRGSYSMYGNDGNLQSSGKSLAVWKKKDGQWYLYWEMFNEGGSLTDTADDVPTTVPFVLQKPQKPK